MEIRSGIESRMDDSDSSPIKKTSSDECPRPISPCDSEISVGCEHDSGEPAAASPMDMTEDTDGETAGASPASTHSQSESRGIPSPQSLSPSSARDGSESFTYLSEDEYFRPLKRLAMSDTSPHPPSSTREAMSESLSSPEPSRPHSKHHSADHPTTQPIKPKLPAEEINERVSPSGDRGTEEGDEGDAEIMDRLENRGNAVDQKISAGLRSFSILDILSYKPSRRKSSIPVKIVRPWDTREESTNQEATPTRPTNHESSNRSNNNSDHPNNNNNSKKTSSQNDRGSALDALFKMTNKTLDNLNKEDKADAVNLFNNRQPSKKKRKSRTAFTNHQIFELEKRFLYQKYLSPADRDELAQSLGLSNAQVITWFQNRRAKLKRDMEELKRDVETSKIIHNKSLLEAASANVVAFLKAKELPKIHLTALQQ